MRQDASFVFRPIFFGDKFIRSLTMMATLMLMVVSDLGAGEIAEKIPNQREISTADYHGSCADGWIENFEVDSYAPYQSATFTWSAADVGFTPTYEIVRLQDSTYCDALSSSGYDWAQEEVVGSTTQTSFVAPFGPTDRVYGFYVRVKDCHNVLTRHTFVFDTATKTPETPSLTVSGVNGNRVTLELKNHDPYSFILALTRWPAGQQDQIEAPGIFQPHDFCPLGSAVVFEEDLNSGVWDYQAVVRNAAGAATSEIVQVAVDADHLPQVRFTASPAAIGKGESTTLIWNTENASSVTIDPGLGSQPLDGAISVTPETTTTYTLSATGPEGTTTQQVRVVVFTQPVVVVRAEAEALVQGTSAGGATTRYVLANVGGAATDITLTQTGDFFTQEPESFTLEPGGVQAITITGKQRDTGSYQGKSIPSGEGIPSGAAMPVRLLSVPTPDGPTAAESVEGRVIVSSPEGENPTGTVTFRNTGEAKILATLVTPVPWLIPEEGLIEVEPGETVTVSFRIDRSRRPAGIPIGSLEGRLGLVFRKGPSGKRGSFSPENGGAETTTTLVTVVDTSQPQVAPGEIPPLAEGEVALFIPGAGNVQGGAGLFFSDITLVNTGFGSDNLSNIALYYTPLESDETLTTTVSSLVSNVPLPLADIAKTVFNAEGTIGSLQIRAERIEDLSVNANILLRTRGEEKTFGNTIPALRSDRSLGPGESFYVTGLSEGEESHTNLFVQETSGGTVTVDIDFLDEMGQKLGEKNDVKAEGFGLVAVFGSVPDGAVTAVITSRESSTGRFAAYATPVDEVSGDSWSLVDWNAQNGFSGSEEMIIPLSGAVVSGGKVFFRTGFAVTNRGDTAATGILTYLPDLPGGLEPIERSISLGPGQSVVYEDVTTSLFDFDPSQATLGFMKFLPQSSSMTVTSRNYATVGDEPGTFGTGVAVLASSEAMRLGEVRRIGGIRDSTLEARKEGVPGSFRSNFGMMEVSGEGDVTIRVTIHYTFSTSLVVARGSASKEYTLGPNEYSQYNRISAEILGDAREEFGDFDNLQADFAVVGGDGAAAVWVSSVENDSSDSILRVD